MSARHRLGNLLLRQGVTYPGKTAWATAHHAWLRRQRFEQPILREAPMSNRPRRSRSILDRDTPPAEHIVLRYPERAYQTDNAWRTDPHITTASIQRGL